MIVRQQFMIWEPNSSNQTVNNIVVVFLLTYQSPWIYAMFVNDDVYFVCHFYFYCNSSYPHCYCHVSPYFNSYTCLFLIAWTFSFILLSNHLFSHSMLLPFPFNMFSIRIFLLCLLFISFYFPMISPCLCSSFLSTCVCSFIKYFSSLVIDYFGSWSWR